MTLIVTSCLFKSDGVSLAPSNCCLSGKAEGVCSQWMSEWMNEWMIWSTERKLWIPAENVWGLTIPPDSFLNMMRMETGERSRNNTKLKTQTLPVFLVMTSVYGSKLQISYWGSWSIKSQKIVKQKTTVTQSQMLSLQYCLFWATRPTIPKPIKSSYLRGWKRLY